MTGFGSNCNSGIATNISATSCIKRPSFGGRDQVLEVINDPTFAACVLSLPTELPRVVTRKPIRESNGTISVHPMRFEVWVFVGPHSQHPRP